MTARIRVVEFQVPPTEHGWYGVICDAGTDISTVAVYHVTYLVNSATHRYSLTHELIANDQVRKVICTAARGHDKEPSPFETR